MKIKFKFKKSLGAIIILAGLVFVPLSFAMANSGVLLYLTPSQGTYSIGDLINVSVMVNTKDKTINAVKSTLSFNEKLEVQSISKSGSILGLWIEEPSYDNSLRTISLGGAGAGTAYEGSAGKLISIVFKAKSSGEGTINFSSSLVKYGATTVEVDSAVGSSYTIKVSCNCTFWQNSNCGEGDCSVAQRLQTRDCTPSGCSLENRCIEDSSCVEASVIEKEDIVEEEEPIQEDEVVTEQQPAAQETTFLAAIGNILSFGTDNIWVSLFTGGIILAILVYFILRLRRKKP